MDVSQVFHMSLAVVLAWWAYDHLGELFHIGALERRRYKLADKLAQAEATIREAGELREGIAETRATLRDLDATRREKIATWTAEAVDTAQRENEELFARNHTLREESTRLVAEAGERRRELAERQRLFDLDMARMRAAKCSLVDQYEAEARGRLRAEIADVERQRADAKREWRRGLEDVARREDKLRRWDEQLAAQAHEMNRQWAALGDAQQRLDADHKRRRSETEWNAAWFAQREMELQARAMPPTYLTLNVEQMNFAALAAVPQPSGALLVQPDFFLALAHGDPIACMHARRMIESAPTQ